MSILDNVDKFDYSDRHSANKKVDTGSTYHSFMCCMSFYRYLYAEHLKYCLENRNEFLYSISQVTKLSLITLIGMRGGSI